MRIRKNFENIFRRVFINNFSFFFFFNIFESAFEARLTEGNFFFCLKNTNYEPVGASRWMARLHPSC